MPYPLRALKSSAGLKHVTEISASRTPLRSSLLTLALLSLLFLARARATWISARSLRARIPSPFHPLSERASEGLCSRSCTAPARCALRNAAARVNFLPLPPLPPTVPRPPCVRTALFSSRLGFRRCYRTVLDFSGETDAAGGDFASKRQKYFPPQRKRSARASPPAQRFFLE